ncbi:MAG TPA: CopG family transcriptional regulator [Chloroflexota bacterium]|nr:CopG family transcriptional regulator [Chloroflexota bacterium]
MTKTTVYLPENLKLALSRMAASRGRSEADLIREAISSLTATAEPQRPRGGFLHSGDPTLAERVDDVLAEGFGQL